jgi:hypothetical protein
MKPFTITTRSELLEDLSELLEKYSNDLVQVSFYNKGGEVWEMVIRFKPVEVVFSDDSTIQQQEEDIHLINQDHNHNKGIKYTKTGRAIPTNDVTINKRPLIGDAIPQDPFDKMFVGKNANANTTRYGDRQG